MSLALLDWWKNRYWPLLDTYCLHFQCMWANKPEAFILQPLSYKTSVKVQYNIIFVDIFIECKQISYSMNKAWNLKLSVLAPLPTDVGRHETNYRKTGNSPWSQPTHRVDFCTTLISACTYALHRNQICNAFLCPWMVYILYLDMYWLWFPPGLSEKT